MTHPLLSRLAGRFVSVAVFTAASLNAFAQSIAPAAPVNRDPVPLERYVISATRSLQDPRETPSAVTLVDLPELRATQVPDLRSALAQQAGVVVVTTGAAGGQTSVFLRGANAHQTLFVVDGVRLNDRSASYINFLGAADFAGLDRLEVLRGPQSTLYGSSAMGGVILMNTTHGSGPASGRGTVVAGSFDTWGGGAIVEGSSGGLGYSASVSHYDTDNDLPRNAFRQTSASTRIEKSVTDTWLVGGTFRWLDSDVQETGSRFFPAPGDVDSITSLGTAYAQFRPNASFTSRLTVAQHNRSYTFADQWFTSELRNRRRILDWLNTWQVSEPVEIVAGANYERSRFRVDGAPTYDRVWAGHVTTTIRPNDTLTFTGGVRHDDFDSVGSATTWRAGVAWRVLPATKLRATYGTGFAAPGSEDRFGVPGWGQLPNPDLRPEESDGWDVGIDQDLLDGRATLSATYFHNDFRDLFDWETVDFTTFQGRTVNRARATTKGVELALAARPWHRVEARVAYTYLEAEDDATGARLQRRPRSTVDGDVRVELMPGWSIGAGAHVVGSRIDAGTTMDDYTTARVFTRYALTNGIELAARVENAFDEAYEEVLGYPALPRAVYGSVEWSF